MSEDWFDSLATAAARGVSRRQTLKLLAGILLSGLIGTRGFRPAIARADTGCAETLVAWYPGCLQAVAKSPPVPPPSTGCDPPVQTFPPVPGVSFDQACLALDQCYGRCGTPELGCDADFLLDMQLACFTQVPPVNPEAQLAQALCLGYALNNYALQQAVGVSQYDAAQSAVCDCCGCDDDAQCAELSFDLSCCSRKCVDKQTDADNCGSCGNVCPPGDACVSGTCTHTTLKLTSKQSGTFSGGSPGFEQDSGTYDLELAATVPIKTGGTNSGSLAWTSFQYELDEYFPDNSGQCYNPAGDPATVTNTGSGPTPGTVTVQQLTGPPDTSLTVAIADAMFNVHTVGTSASGCGDFTVDGPFPVDGGFQEVVPTNGVTMPSPGVFTITGWIAGAPGSGVAAAKTIALPDGEITLTIMSG